MSSSHVEFESKETIGNEPIQYRAISGLAVLAPRLGVLSAAAMVGPVLWFVPLLAIVVALVAMRRIRTSEDLTGWNIAFLGLLLAMLFGIAALARIMSRQYWLASRAEQYSDQFFEYLQQNKPHAAHQLKERPGVRKPLTDKLEEAYAKDPESQKSLEKFVGDEPAKSLLQYGDQSSIERIATDFIGRDDRSDLLGVRYRITPAAREKPMTVVTLVKRSLDLSTGLETWQIENVAVE